jgi:ribosomal protein S6
VQAEYYESNSRAGGLPDFFICMVDTQEKDGRVYELAILYSPMLTEETLLASYGDLKALLEKHGASFISEEMPKMMELAYEMSRIIDNKKTWFSTAYFGWVKFETEPSEIAAFEEILARNEQVIRFMTIKTIRESTMSSKKVHREYRKRDDKAEGEPAAAPISKEEVDKQIDALIAE